jgi:pilus assembly protein CpaE
MIFRKRATETTGIRAQALLSNPATARIVESTLSGVNGFKLDIIAGGVSARATDGSDPDILIIELNPSNSGELYELRRRMQGDLAKKPVIVTAERLDQPTVRALIQMRVTDWLPTSILAEELAEACEKAVEASASDNAVTGARCITYLAASGGVGTTTTAIESAHILMRPDKKSRTSTCLVDLDFQAGEVADFLDLQANLQVQEIGPNPSRLDMQMLDVMLSWHQSGLGVLAAGNSVGGYEDLKADFVTRLLDLAAMRFDNIVIDMPRQWQPWTDDILLGSDKVFVVTDTSVPGLRRAKLLIEALRKRHGQNIELSVVVNRYRTRFGFGVKKREIMSFFDGRVAGFIPNDERLVGEAIDRGVPLSDVKRASKVSKAIASIVLGP